jgi:hypothetical protein
MRRSAISAGVNLLTVGWLMDPNDDASIGAAVFGATVPVDQGSLEVARLVGQGDEDGVVRCS